ncbi:hypothetical protein C8R43DRAFT_908180, partial [Mycena crocata]
EQGLTEAQVRLDFAKEEARQAELGVPSLHDVSPSSFIYAGLELEEQQRRLRVQTALKRAKSTGQQISLTGLRAKLSRGIRRFRKLQSTYTPAALHAAARAAAVRAKLRVEDAALFLPSGLTAEERAVGCAPGLENIEALARDAQCRTALVSLRNQLHIKCRLLVYKKSHARHQGANLRSRTIVARNEAKIGLHSSKYQAAWSAIRLLKGGDASKVGWLKLRKQDIRLMEEPEELSRRMAKKKKQLERQRDGERTARPGENHRDISWIWKATGSGGTDAQLEDGT